MKINRKVIIETEVRAICLTVPVHHEDEQIPYTFPGREGDVLTLTLLIDSCKVKDWPKEYGPANCYLKVCDQGTYELLDDQYEIVGEIVNDYVPSCVPNDYSDYINLDIEEDGRVINWYPTQEQIEDNFFGF